MKELLISSKAHKAIKLRRFALGLSQQNISKKSGLSQASISKFESSGINLSFTDYFKLLEALKIKVLFKIDNNKENNK